MDGETRKTLSHPAIMPHIRCLLLLPLILPLAVMPTLAQNVEESASPDLTQLIEQLGADSFHDREEAMSELVKIGPPAEKAVEAAIESVDPEVAYRARKVIKEIDRSLIAQRRKAFLEGDVAKLKTNAASWKRMEEMLGNTRESRELFLQMQVAGEDILTAAEENPRHCAQQISTLYNEDQQARRFGGQGLAPGAVAAMVFASSDDRVPLDATTLSRCTSLLYRYRGSLGENELFQDMLGEWVTVKGDSGPQQYQLLRLCQQFKLPEGVKLARKMVGGCGHTSYKAHAMLTIGMFGGEDDVELLKGLISNDTKVGSVARSGNKRIECRLGDVALGMVLALTEQNAKDYGFTNASNGRPTSSSYYNYGFVDNEARTAARQKWAEYLKAQEERSKQ